MKKRILAMPAAEAAMPPNPRTAAITATTRKTSVQLSMSNLCQQSPRRGLELSLPGTSTGGEWPGSGLHLAAGFVGGIVDSPHFEPVPVNGDHVLHHMVAVELEDAEAR